MSANTIGFSFIMLGMFLIIGKILRVHIKWLRDLILPSSIIAGFIAIFVGPEVLGRLTQAWLEQDAVFYYGFLSSSVLEVWNTLPGRKWLWDKPFRGNSMYWVFLS
ncbi:hypothetical protein [Amphibacillus cookii]|uniref:hypothetical protein n=1 Tax=Amphibacillus cookii TaxID=767787 RepID=UPI0019592527|nr:hypothetical protein [Amphibacillus cookii]MBM7540998.1 Na+/glutamate symporter [Amphibacillus cookii]